MVELKENPYGGLSIDSPWLTGFGEMNPPQC